MNDLIVGLVRGLLVTTVAVTVLTFGEPAAAGGDGPIVVRNTAELEAALVEQNAGRVILVRRGQYPVTGPLLVPDGVRLLGAGLMRGTSQPGGFKPDTVTRIYAATPFSGNLLTLGDDVTLQGLVIEHAVGAVGNAVNVASRAPGDLQAVTIVACEIVNPNPSGIGPGGPTGEGIALVTSNPNLGAEPPPHEGAQIDLTLRRSIVRAEAGGAALFAINFAARGLITISLTHNLIAGNFRLVGAVSRPDPVSNAAMVVSSTGNVYSGRNLGVQLPGWQIYAGSTVPAPLPAAETRGNTVHFTSRNDRLEGFQLAVLAAGGVRSNALPGPAVDNRLDLKLQQLTISTPDDGISTDFSLHGALSLVDSAPGEGNELTVLARGVQGSGYRNNVYSSTTVQGLPNADAANALSVVGTPEWFEAVNQDVLPAPEAAFFSGTPRQASGR